jgi:hypothetical protein
MGFAVNLRTIPTLHRSPSFRLGSLTPPVQGLQRLMLAPTMSCPVQLMTLFCLAVSAPSCASDTRVKN